MRLISDFALAAACIWGEARGEPFAGKIAVGNVIRNRMAKHHLSATEIVLAPHQFSCFLQTDPNYIPLHMIDDTDSTAYDCTRAWIASEANNLVEGSTLYANLDVVTPSWLKDVSEVVKIGRHTFFEETVVGGTAV